MVSRNNLYYISTTFTSKANNYEKTTIDYTCVVLYLVFKER